MISACILDLPLFTGPGWRRLKEEGGVGGTDGGQKEGRVQAGGRQGEGWDGGSAEGEEGDRDTASTCSRMSLAL